MPRKPRLMRPPPKDTEAMAAPPPAASNGFAPGLQEVPFSVLHISPLNPRTVIDDVEIVSISENIDARGGVKQNLVVRPEPHPVTGAPGLGVLSGGRRWRGVERLVRLGRRPANCLVPVNIDLSLANDVDALEWAIEENDQRQQLTPLEQGAAYCKAHELGDDIDTIAAKAARTRKFVTQRMGFHTRLSARVKAALRDGGINLGQAEEFTVGEKDEQERLLADLIQHPGSYRAGMIRAALVGPHIPLSRARFDVALYRGAKRRDLFGEEDYAEDRAEFARLQRDAALRIKDELAGDGWAWVEFVNGGLQLWQYDQSVGKADGGGAVVSLRDNLEIAIYTGLKKPQPAAATPTPAREHTPHPRFVPPVPGRGPSVSRMLAEGSPAPAAAPADEPVFSREHLVWARRGRSFRTQLAMAARADVVLSWLILGFLECDEVGVSGIIRAIGAPDEVRSPAIDALIEQLLPVGFPGDAFIALVRRHPERAFQALMAMGTEQRGRLLCALTARQFQCFPETQEPAALGDSALTVAVADELAALAPGGFQAGTGYLERLSLSALKRIGAAIGVADAAKAASRDAAIDALALTDELAGFAPPELHIAPAAEIAAVLSGGRQ
jgi:ParB family transcriptional regulator, chromosome partitioning protein